MTLIARRLRRDPTPAEARLWGIVRRKQCGGLRFLRQHDVGHYVLDFYCASANVAVEIDGAIHDRPDVAAYDRERETVLQEVFGIRFVRFTNDFVLTATDGAIRDYLLHSLPPAAPSPLTPSLIRMREGEPDGGERGD